MPLGASTVDTCQGLGWVRFGGQDKTGVPWPWKAEETTARWEQGQIEALSPEQAGKSRKAGQDPVENLCDCIEFQPAFIAHLYSQ